MAQHARMTGLVKQSEVCACETKGQRCFCCFFPLSCHNLFRQDINQECLRVVYVSTCPSVTACGRANWEEFQRIRGDLLLFFFPRLQSINPGSLCINPNRSPFWSLHRGRGWWWAAWHLWLSWTSRHTNMPPLEFLIMVNLSSLILKKMQPGCVAISFSTSY